MGDSICTSRAETRRAGHRSDGQSSIETQVDPAIYRPSSGLFYGVRVQNGAVVLNTNLGQASGDTATTKVARPTFRRFAGGGGPDVNSSTAGIDYVSTFHGEGV